MSDEVDISAALRGSPAKKDRKRKSTSLEEEEDDVDQENYPRVFATEGTSLTPAVQVSNQEEWDDWKERELIKKKWRAYLRSKWDLRVDKLPMVSDSEHYVGRHEHYANVRKAQQAVEASCDAFTEKFNVGVGSNINMQFNDKDVSKKRCKKFAADVAKVHKKMGKPTIEELLTDDLNDEERAAEEEWTRQYKKKSKKQRLLDLEIQENERGHGFEPWEEYVAEMEDNGKEHKIGEKHFKKWLENKIEENKVTENFNAYQLDLKALDEDAFKNKKSLKSVVKGIQKYYRKLRENSKK